MVNYQNTKIYKIESHLGPKIYIGSTTKQLSPIIGLVKYVLRTLLKI